MYREAPKNALFQGDIVIVPMPTMASPDPQLITQDGPPQAACASCGTTAKKFTTNRRQISVRAKKGNLAAAFDSDDTTDAFMPVRSVVAIIMSHSCDVDRQANIRFAAVWSIMSLGSYQRARVEARETGNFSYFFLDSYGSMPRAVVDFDCQFWLPVDHLGTKKEFDGKLSGRREHALVPYVEAIENRIASLNADALVMLYQAAIRHFVRPGEAQTDVQRSPGVFEDEPGRPAEAHRVQRGWWWPRPKWLLSPR